MISTGQRKSYKKKTCWCGSTGQLPHEVSLKILFVDADSMGPCILHYDNGSRVPIQMSPTLAAVV